MACTNVFDAFAVATESLDQDVYLRAAHDSVWLNLVPRSTYKSNSGLTQTTFTIGLSEPSTDEATWSAVTLATGSNSGACATSFNDAEFGYNAATYSPETYDLRGPVLCKDDLIFDHNPQLFLEKYIRALTIHAKRIWERRYEKLYMNFSSKAVATGSFTIQAAQGSFTLPIATSEITQEMLDTCSVTLTQRGATTPDSQGFIQLGDNGPLFSLLIGQEASAHLATNNSEFRNDIRYATMGQPAGQLSLLQRIGATRVIKNFRHVINLFPPRFTYNGTAYVRVNTFTNSAGTKGTVSTVNSSWLTAPYEAAIIITPWVFRSEIIKPVNEAAGLSWNPMSYMGEWKFVTGAFKWDTSCTDALEKYGRHFAQFKHAARPVFPEYGITVIFKRCPVNNYSTVYCT